MGLGVQALSDALVASGGIGLGAMIARAMHAKADAAQNVPAVGGPGMAQPTPAAAAFVPAAHPESVQNQAPTENSGKS
jgi:Rod binding domain-containing protein